MLKNLAFRTRGEGVEMGQKLANEGLIEHVVEEQPFRDAFLFFRFTVCLQPSTRPRAISVPSSSSLMWLFVSTGAYIMY